MLKKKFTKKIIIFAFLACFTMPFFPSCGFSKDAEFLSEQLKATITREEFADFYDTLVIEPENEELGIGDINLKNFTFIGGKLNLIQDELFSMRSPYFEPDIFVKKQREEQRKAERNAESSRYGYSRQGGRRSVTNVRISQANPTVERHFSVSEAKSSLEAVAETKKGGEFEEKLKAAAILLEKDKNSPKARQELLELENAAGENGVNLSNVAKLYIKIGENGRAKDLLSRAESLSPQNYKVIYTNAVFLYKNNDLVKAEEKLVKVSHLNPGFMHAHYNLGNIYYRQNEYKKAIESFKKAMELAPENSDIYFNIGMTLEAMGQKDLARKFYSKVLELNPNDKEALKAVERL